MRMILAIVLVLLLIGMLPVMPYAGNWGLGWFPSGILGFILLIVLISALMGGRRGDPI